MPTAGGSAVGTGVLSGASGRAGASTGGLVDGHLPDAVLLVTFAVRMTAASAAMLRGRCAVGPDRTHQRLPVGKVLPVGAGGGFLLEARPAGRVPSHVLSRLVTWFAPATGGFALIQQVISRWRRRHPRGRRT
ncbi:hypothetical protein [Streptomyces chilikensis]|uniref:Uncharacterized protein n=1 Tax=Streptomyces chilikensis TaxID=1194079 RepID=A0ABV3EK12_9ACTN